MTGEEDGQEAMTPEEVAHLRQELEEAKRLAGDRLTRIQYLQADFDNYRKGLEREKEQAVRLAGESLTRDLLPVLDDLEKAVPCLSHERDREGFQLLARKLYQILRSHGLERIESLGKKFDPNLHEVIAKGGTSAPGGTILEEYQAGYLLRSRVLRPAKVKIAEDTGECTEENHG